MKKILPIFLLFFLNSVLAQKQGQARIDSLTKELEKTTNDTLKARIYNRIAEGYFFISNNKALIISKIGLAHTTKMNWIRGVGVFDMNIGRAYSGMGNYDSCMYYYKAALKIHQQNDDKFNLATVLNNMGAAEQNIRSDYPKATKYYFQALKVAESSENKYVVATCYDNIAEIYGIQNNYQKALTYRFKSLRIREQLTTIENTEVYNLREVGNSLTSIATTYTTMKQYKNAQAYFIKSIAIHQKIGNKEGLAKSYSYLSVTYHTDFNKKIDLALKASKLWEEVNLNHIDALTNIANIGIAYFDLAKKDSFKSDKNKNMALAELYLNKAISGFEKTKETASKSYFMGSLAELQALKGNYKSAYLNFRAYQEAQDSLYSQESKNKIASIESEREISLRDKQLEINQLAIASQRKQQIALFIGLALLTIIGGLLFWQNLTRKRTNTTLLHLNNELDEANKIKAKFFGILSHDLRSPVSNLINFLHLQKSAPELLTPELAEKHQQKITESAETLLENMEAMLLWSKSQMQHFEPQIKRVEVTDLFEYIQKFFADNTEIHFDFENKEALSVFSDEDYLKTIMQNLTNNAVKALKNKHNPQIIWKAIQENQQIVLSITDNGTGISEQQLKTLFTEENVISSKIGLGLHLIRDLAKAIACKISVKSSLGLGSEFQLIFVK
jgi:signal transduction histidine kinase